LCDPGSIEPAGDKTSGVQHKVSAKTASKPTHLCEPAEPDLGEMAWEPAAGEVPREPWREPAGETPRLPRPVAGLADDGRRPPGELPRDPGFGEVPAEVERCTRHHLWQKITLLSMCT
jgi:hypothetical protein